MKRIKPSSNPLNWNWTAIITWACISYISWHAGKFLILSLLNIVM